MLKNLVSLNSNYETLLSIVIRLHTYMYNITWSIRNQPP